MDDCATRTTCDACVSETSSTTGCGWCSATSSCMAGGYGGSAGMSECEAGDWWVDECAPVRDPIVVTSPATGDTWKAGFVYNITWSGAAAETSVYIQYQPVAGGEVWAGAAGLPEDSVPNTARYEWGLESGLAAGDYRIVILDSRNDFLFGISAPFTIDPYYPRYRQVTSNWSVGGTGECGGGASSQSRTVIGCVESDSGHEVPMKYCEIGGGVELALERATTMCIDLSHRCHVLVSSDRRAQHVRTPGYGDLMVPTPCDSNSQSDHCCVGGCPDVCKAAQWVGAPISTCQGPCGTGLVDMEYECKAGSVSCPSHMCTAAKPDDRVQCD